MVLSCLENTDVCALQWHILSATRRFRHGHLHRSSGEFRSLILSSLPFRRFIVDPKSTRLAIRDKRVSDTSGWVDSDVLRMPLQIMYSTVDLVFIVDVFMNFNTG